jgi:hypothetical protein
VIYQVTTILVATSYDIPVTWYYYGLYFPLYTWSHLYNRTSLITIFGSGPIVALVVAYIFYRLFFRQKAVNSSFQMLYLWGIICGLNMFFGAYIVGFSTRTEFIYTTEWLFMNEIFDIREILLTIVCVGMMIYIGRLLAPMFLISSGSVTLTASKYRFFVLICYVLFPWLTSVLILFLVTTPLYYVPFLLKTITPILLIGPALFTFNSSRTEDILSSSLIKRKNFQWGIVVFVIIVMIIYRVVLNFGWSYR